MSKVKLDLYNKDNDTLLHFATTHRDAIAGNIAFSSPVPDATAFDATLQLFEIKLTEITDAEVALATLRSERDVSRENLENSLRERGQYVQTTSAGDEAIILSAAFEVQNAPEPTSSIPKPDELHASMGDNPGEVDVSCHAVPKARTYIYEMRDHIDADAPGAWAQAEISTRSSASLVGMTSGMRYGFRIRALGPNDLKSPWSEEVTCMAP